jgi:hypothetical protein
LKSKIHIIYYLLIISSAVKVSKEIETPVFILDRRGMMDTDVPQGTMDTENLRRAMKAFKKRLKLTRLDDESGLGHGSAEKSRGSGIVAIRPPDNYPQAVWDKLVELGRLQKAGAGLYQIRQDNTPR